MLDELIRVGRGFSKIIMEVADAVQRQRDFFRSGATRSLEFRRGQLARLKQAINDQEFGLLEALRKDLRKSETEAYASELAIVLNDIDHAQRQLFKWMKPRKRRVPLISWPARALIQPEPYGVVLILAPWNYPMQLLLSPLIGAIAAGNCALVKPSEAAPQSSAALAQLIASAFPAEYISTIQGDSDASQALLREKFDKIFFTGSTRAGREVMLAAARHLTPVTLELGGKCPCIVCADAPPDITARRIVWGKFLNAGQTCVAPDFVLVDRRIRTDLVEAMKAAIRQFYGDDPQQSPDYSRIINASHFERLAAYLSQGKIVFGGRQDPGDLFISPTLLIDVLDDAPVMREEIFGPILPVQDFTYLDDALAALQNRPIPLATYLFTKDRTLQEKVIASTRSGGVCINDTILQIVNKHLPFGGMGESGMGSYHGKASFDCFTHQRPVLKRFFRFESKLRYPPSRMSLPKMKRAFKYLLGR